MHYVVITITINYNIIGNLKFIIKTMYIIIMLSLKIKEDRKIKKKNEKRIKISIAYSFAANEREKSIKSCRQPSCKETSALAFSHEGHCLSKLVDLSAVVWGAV